MSTPVQVWSYRTLIANLTQRDLKARYKRSVLGWLWSLINPAATLGIYTLVFGVFLGGQAPAMGSGREGNFALFLFTGLVAWNLFSGIVNGSITAFASAGPLLTRTYFPPECPLFATVAAVVLQSLLETSILLFFMVVVGNISWTFLVFIPVFALLACFGLGVGMVLSVLNIRYRDVAYLTGILLQIWFYATPIVYVLDTIPAGARKYIELNPINAYVNAMRRGFYFLDLPTLTNWIVMVSSASISLAFGWWLFGRLAPRVIEELMASDAIVVEHVSKDFRLQTDRASSLKELITRRDRKSGADQFRALDDVSFAIPEGSMYALVGHNGSGKSTLLRCIAGIYQPTSGSVRAAGRISTLLELGAGFHPDLTGRENVYMNATILGMSKRDIDRSFDDMVEFAGIGDFIDSPVKIYSSGMYVRLGFSVAVHVDPEILIIDEVIAVGDTEFQRKCFDHLYSLRKKGTTIVVVTHGLGTVEQMCDGAAWLDHGVLQMTGTGAEISAAYTDRVNARERAERERIAVEARDAGDDDAAGEATGTDAPRSVEDIQIERVELVGPDGEVGDVGIYREPFTIRIQYVATSPVINPVFGIAIHTAAMVHVTGTNTRIDDTSLGTIEGRGHVDFHVDALPLTPGDYELTVAISDEFIQHNYDRREREYHLRVRSGTDRQTPEGVIDMRGQWSSTSAVDVTDRSAGGAR